jgi:hypothetical protein
MAVEVGDDALEPVLSAGSRVIVDCSDHGLEGGGIYAVRDGDRLDLWLYQPGFDGLGCRFAGRSIGTLTVLGGSFRLRGPLAVEAIRLVGRVVEPGPDRPQASCASSRRSSWHCARPRGRRCCNAASRRVPSGLGVRPPRSRQWPKTLPCDCASERSLIASLSSSGSTRSMRASLFSTS